MKEKYSKWKMKINPISLAMKLWYKETNNLKKGIENCQIWSTKLLKFKQKITNRIFWKRYKSILEKLFNKSKKNKNTNQDQEENRCLHSSPKEDKSWSILKLRTSWNLNLQDLLAKSKMTHTTNLWKKESVLTKAK